VLRQEFIDYVICGLQEELRQRHEAFELGLKALRDERPRIEAELRRLVESIAVGNGSPTVMAAITEREARLREIMNRVIEPGPGSLQEKLEELRTFAVSRLTRLRELLTNPGAIHEARALLAEQIGKFTLERVEENGKVSFKANGNIDFFGEEAFTRVGGAGARHGPNVCRFVSSGWPRHESEANLPGLDLGTFRRRPALGGCRVVRLAGIEDWDTGVYGGDQEN